ncbi:MAG: CRISPR-associated helicase Cas3' [Sulfurimonas sp.]|nr:CRISPR-associated helicase Cas3' [Sulfurimonas sp.]
MYLDLNIFGVDDSFLAHTPNETLPEHLECTKKYLEKIVKDKHLEALIDGLIEAIDKRHSKLIKEMFYNAIYLHDLGKMNPCFQSKKMSNPLFKEHENCSNSKHSFGGVVYFIDYYKPIIEKIEEDSEYYRLIYILYNFTYHISKHHGRLGQIEEYLSDKREEHSDFENIKKNVSLYLDEKFEFYILNKLLFSLLVSSDYYATSEYMANMSIDNFGLFSLEDKHRLKTLFDGFITKFGEPKGINKLRNKIFKEAEYNLLQNLDKHIYYLEAPTGSGKTITSINLALKLLESDTRLNKLFYIFPFNTLVEQTKSVFDNIFGDDLKIETINSISPIVLEKEQEDNESNYTQSYMNRLFFHSPAIITTHVSLFNILFGTSKEDNFPLWQLANSVIILDEIQSYNNNLWWYMVEFFDKYAELLNIKIIIMSATLPKLDFFLEKKSNFVDLIRGQKRDDFFTNDYFSKRVEVDFELLEEGEIDFDRLEEFFDEVKDNYQKILFEFIKKQSAREFYNQIKKCNKNVYELSGDDNKAYRQYVINKSKEDKPIIIVATQVIEAGVDIDMDLGFKDISTLDSEEQFMGRINRSCKKSDSKVYFFNMDDVFKIYRGDNRLGFDLTQKKYQTILRDKNYYDYYQEVLKVIQKNGLRFDSGVTTNIDKFSEMLQKLNYQEIAKTMTLINSENFTLYFPFMIDISIYERVKEFENIGEQYLTDCKLDGWKVWNAYLSLSEVDSFTEKEFKRSHVNTLMQFFTFNIVKYVNMTQPHYYSEKIGGFYLVEDWEPFIDKDGKFNRVAYQEKSESQFL